MFFYNAIIRILKTKPSITNTVFFFSAAGQNVTYKTELSKFLFCNNYV